MEKEHTERLKRVALAAIPLVLGAIAVKNVRDKKTGDLANISYYEASRLVFLDLIKETQDKIIHVSGEVTHGPGGKEDVASIEIHDNDLTGEEVQEVVEAFTNFGERLPEDSL